jgi:hypothetical protein
MRKIVSLAFVSAVVMWATFAAVLLGIYKPSWMPAEFLKLSLPISAADFGQAFSALEGLLSAFALIVGLIAILIQTRQNADSNVIGAFTARQVFLLADCVRLEESIQAIKRSGKPQAALFNNMVEKKMRQYAEVEAIDEKLKALLDKL